MQTIEYFELEPVKHLIKPEPNCLMTAAILECSCCHDVISSMGGGSSTALCQKCAKKLENGEICCNVSYVEL